MDDFGFCCDISKRQCKIEEVFRSRNGIDERKQAEIITHRPKTPSSAKRMAVEKEERTIIEWPDIIDSEMFVCCGDGDVK
mmetsp:Transcript_33324/g.67251  ORF Transcript_33324/g.67251 Transcript_33324/m.67251 type:complete len:80 (+) Transcript_33324:6-245(+)